MFKVLKIFLASVAALFVVAKVVPGISYQNNLQVLLSAALVFAVLHSVVNPILNFFTLPLNFLTLGLVSAVINVGLFYAVSYLVPSFIFSPFEFAGFSFSALGTVIIGAVVVSILLGVFESLLDA